MAISLTACGGGDEATSTTASGPCEQVDAPPPKHVHLKRPTKTVSPGEKITATVRTSCGDFSFDLDTKTSPKTTSSFVHMVDEGLYDDTTFHRVVSGALIQGGDPAQTDTSDGGYTITERPPASTSYTRGTVAMARSSTDPPGISGSQFFVVTAADANLPPSYALLGHVTGGESTIDAIEAEGDSSLGPTGGPPVIPVVVDTITLS